MGNGRYKNGRFDLVTVANHVMRSSDYAEWQRCFGKVSEILFNASEGQMSFGNIFACDDSIGIDSADVILYQAGDPSYSHGRFGSAGAAVHLMPYVKTQVLSLLHELGHYVWGIKDEYCAPYLFEQVDRSQPSPDKRTIPIVNSHLAANELANKNATVFLVFGNQIERRSIVTDTATSITVDLDFPFLPTDADSDWAVVQTPAECSAVARANYCIMEKSRAAAGYFDGAGNWQDAPYPITEFCSASNHDPDQDTDQQSTHNQSCWETITDQASFETLTAPNPASGVPPAGFVPATWIVLDKQPRFVLVLDRSGSMAAGHKMRDVQHGAVYWLEYCALGDDALSIIWYDNQIDATLPLTQVNTLPDLTSQISAINALTPRGTTNIRDALYEGLDQIQSLPTRAAVQVALLLTDGMHNTPSGSRASEVLPSFREAGARIYTLGVGGGNSVDMNVLDELAAQTAGKSYAVGDDQPAVIDSAMVEINAQVRGGIITTNPLTFPDSAPSTLDRLSKQAKRRPPLEEILENLQVKSIEQLIGNRSGAGARMLLVPVDVEEGMERVSFTLVYPEGAVLWLYLLSPDGKAVDMRQRGVQHVMSPAPHEFALVARPGAGRWYMVAVRPFAGAKMTARGIAGGENRHLRVFGGAQEKNAAKAPVAIWAKAQFGDLLSGLRVTAHVVTPGGKIQRVILRDEEWDEPMSGEYRGYLRVSRPGRYYGHISIENTGKATMARPVRRLLESDEVSFDMSANIPPFVRVIPFYFDSGARSVAQDVEHEKGLTSMYEPVRPRRTKLVSSGKKRRPK